MNMHAIWLSCLGWNAMAEEIPADALRLMSHK